MSTEAALTQAQDWLLTSRQGEEKRPGPLVVSAATSSATGPPPQGQDRTTWKSLLHVKHNQELATKRKPLVVCPKSCPLRFGPPKPQGSAWGTQAEVRDEEKASPTKPLVVYRGRTAINSGAAHQESNCP